MFLWTTYNCKVVNATYYACNEPVETIRVIHTGYVDEKKIPFYYLYISSNTVIYPLKQCRRILHLFLSKCKMRILSSGVLQNNTTFYKKNVSNFDERKLSKHRAIGSCVFESRGLQRFIFLGCALAATHLLMLHALLIENRSSLLPASCTRQCLCCAFQFALLVRRSCNAIVPRPLNNDRDCQPSYRGQLRYPSLMQCHRGYAFFLLSRRANLTNDDTPPTDDESWDSSKSR